MSPQPQAKPFLSVRTQTFRTTLLALLALIAITAIQIGAPHWLGQEPGAIDYRIFHYTGELSRSGQPALPYDAPAFEEWQSRQPGGEIFMPWTYPPQFNLFTQGLSVLPVGIGYAAFIGTSLVAFLWALFRLAPTAAIPAAMLTLPAILMNIRAGQNGFLTALLFTLTFLLVLRSRPAGAGATLGCLAYKPHLGLGLGLVTVFRGGLAMVLIAVLVLAASLGAATWAYGSEIWPAFVQSIRDSSTFLRHGAYPMERMTSVYALFRSLGAPSSVSFAAQAAVACTMTGLLIFALARRWRMHHLLAMSCFAGLAISPYGYDYDLVALAPALALAFPALSARTTAITRTVLICAVLVATGWGLLTVVLSVPAQAIGLTRLPALGALGYLVALFVIVPALMRDEANSPA